VQNRSFVVLATTQLLSYTHTHTHTHGKLSSAHNYYKRHLTWIRPRRSNTDTFASRHFRSYPNLFVLGHLGGEPTTSSICCVRLPRCHWDKNNTWQKELRSHWSNNLEQSSGRSATPLAVTAVIWTKTETVFV